MAAGKLGKLLYAGLRELCQNVWEIYGDEQRLAVWQKEIADRNREEAKHMATHNFGPLYGQLVSDSGATVTYKPTFGDILVNDDFNKAAENFKKLVNQQDQNWQSNWHYKYYGVDVADNAAFETGWNDLVLKKADSSVVSWERPKKPDGPRAEPPPLRPRRRLGFAE